MALFKSLSIINSKSDYALIMDKKKLKNKKNINIAIACIFFQFHIWEQIKKIKRSHSDYIFKNNWSVSLSGLLLIDAIRLAEIARYSCDIHADDCDTSWFRRTVRDARCIVGYKHSADTGQRAAQRNENSPSETFNINLLWCEFTWVPVKVRVRAAGSLTTASQGCGECERSGWSGRAHRWLQLSLLFCPAERFFCIPRPSR